MIVAKYRINTHCEFIHGVDYIQTPNKFSNTATGYTAVRTNKNTLSHDISVDLNKYSANVPCPLFLLKQVLTDRKRSGLLRQ